MRAAEQEGDAGAAAKVGERRASRVFHIFEKTSFPQTGDALGPELSEQLHLKPRHGIERRPGKHGCRDVPRTERPYANAQPETRLEPFEPEQSRQAERARAIAVPVHDWRGAATDPTVRMPSEMRLDGR
jgi:hypothetical protein